jgi:hypothetical protein
VKKVNLNWQRPVWEGNQEVVEKSGRDEPMWVIMHMCMEAMIANSLYSYLYLKLAKMLCSSTKLEKREEQALPGSEGCGRRGRGAGDRGDIV